MRTSWSSVFALLACLPLACGDDSGDDSGNQPGTSQSPPVTSTGNPPGDSTDAMPSTAGGATDTTAGPANTTDAESSGDTMPAVPPIIFDLGEIPEAPFFEGACGEVDFLFVIDNSGSMGDEQNTLVANFPAFITGIQQTLEGVDSYHVGVVTTDTYSHNIPGCQNLSSLVVETGGFDSSMMACGPYADGDNFMTENDDLATAFSCAAQIGTDGSALERPMQAVVEAVTEVDGGPGQCNEGFMREDALLVIVIITDESDTDSIGDSQSWFDDVVNAKGGIPENVVVLSIINSPMGMCGFDLAVEIGAFTDLFGVNGFQADICQADYEPFFQEAIGVIDIACDNFIPPD